MSTGEPGTTSQPDLGVPAFECPTSDSLEACYLFEEAGQGVLVDNSGHGWDGTMNAVTAAPGYRGVGAGTSGASQITVTNLAGPPGGPEWTVMAWVKLDSYSPGRAGVINRNNDYGMFIETSHVVSCGGNTMYVKSVKSISVGHWTHLACVRSGGKTTVFLDGQPDQSAMLTVPIPPAQQVVVIANDSPPTPDTAIVGVVDELLMWNTALTTPQICEYAGLTCDVGP